MDNRKPLQPGTVLPFPGMPCTLEEEIGRGSNAMVYKASYPDLMNQGERHMVLVKELFPLHPKGAIFRNEQGEIVSTPAGEETMAVHRRSFQYGNRIHLRMLEADPDRTGANLNTFTLHGTNYTILGYTGGRSLEQEAAGEAAKLRPLTLRLLGLLDALEAFHESGFLHLDIAPDNILLTGRGDKERVMLIDYNSVMEFSKEEAPPYYSVKQGYSAPEIRMGGMPSPASDLYSVTAVFFRCLTGAALTPFQTSRSAPPDVSSCQCLLDLPDTVTSMVRRILRRGLQVLPQKRYQSVSQMRQAVQELLDRIDGVGVTHWALWESGKRMVKRTVQENPSLSYLQKEGELFPASALTESGETLPAGEYIETELALKRGAALLTAAGGMGKTTVLLRAVEEQGKSYSSSRPAVIYLSLYGWKTGKTTDIRDRILEHLRFKADQRSFEDARHALNHLMETPLQTRWGERPVLLLLLDGLNEAAGETGPLIEEILTLSRMRGVSLLISTRSEEPALPFPGVRLVPLTEETVEDRLSRNGLLLPEAPAMRELLRTPLMLSIFVQSSLAEGRQLSVATQEELIGAYFSALLAKELRELPEDADARWQIEAAVSYVLPAIAGEMQRACRDLEDEALLQTVERCYRLFSNRLLRRAFPRWIGHSRAIRGDAANAEEWYGRIVHDLLWKRLGLLVRNERGCYQICHQTIGESLVKIDGENQKRIWGRRRTGLLLLTGVLIVSLFTGRMVYVRYIRPQPYNEIYAESVFAYGLSGYTNAGRQYEAMRALTDCAEERPERFPAELDLAIHKMEDLVPQSSHAEEMLANMLASGDVMPTSGRRMDEEHYLELLKLSDSRQAEYDQMVSVLRYVVEDERANRTYGGTYLELLSELLETDADIAATLYQIVCEPHMEGSYDNNSLDFENYRKLIANVSEQNEHLTEITDLDLLARTLATLRGRRAAVQANINGCGVIAAWKLEGKP